MKDYRYWILYGSELLTIIIPFIISFVFLKVLYKEKGMRANEFIWSCIFAIYIFGVLHFTGSGTLADFNRYGIEFEGHHLNLIPFSQDIDIVAYVLNIMMLGSKGLTIYNSLKCCLQNSILYRE
ncbi:hypothetical protein [[Clostridium] symbiosum]|uniref:hypothetical protein n=1 Tax=Clostridium symbiosum TaxID=1512 RepID=UPI001AA14061|nr:hypothetical protein [[Clostridium] symbiosum]MBO1695172.1 hypothetical protein [[Clostridium] symbiosum]